MKNICVCEPISLLFSPGHSCYKARRDSRLLTYAECSCVQTSLWCRCDRPVRVHRAADSYILISAHAYGWRVANTTACRHPGLCTNLMYAHLLNYPKIMDKNPNTCRECVHPVGFVLPQGTRSCVGSRKKKVLVANYIKDFFCSFADYNKLNRNAITWI